MTDGVSASLHCKRKKTNKVTSLSLILIAFIKYKIGILREWASHRSRRQDVGGWCVFRDIRTGLKVVLFTLFVLSIFLRVQHLILIFHSDAFQTLFKIAPKRYQWGTRLLTREKARRRWTAQYARMEQDVLVQIYQQIPSPRGVSYIDYIVHRMKMFQRGIAAHTTRKYARLSLD